MARTVSARPSRSLSPSQKKGQPWTETEHMAFLAGLEKLGKGNWRGISRFFCPQRTPTQVASHAQKFFLRKDGQTKRRSRFSSVEEKAASAGNVTDGMKSASAAFVGYSYGGWGSSALYCSDFGQYLSSLNSPIAEGYASSWQSAPAFSGVSKAVPQVAVTPRDGPAQFTRICRPVALQVCERRDTLQNIVSSVATEGSKCFLKPSAHSAFRALAQGPIKV